jgi:hypothetical protein
MSRTDGPCKSEAAFALFKGAGSLLGVPYFGLGGKKKYGYDDTSDEGRFHDLLASFLYPTFLFVALTVTIVIFSSFFLLLFAFFSVR